MKLFQYIIVLFSLGLSAQNMHVDNPELVFPILEEFVSQNYSKGTPSMDRLNKLDSVVVRDLGYKVKGPFYTKIHGLHHVQGDVHWIEIDSALLLFPLKFKETLLHELGHVFKLNHINVEKLSIAHPLNYEIMSDPKNLFPYLHISKLHPEIWERVTENYYKSLQTSPQ